MIKKFLISGVCLFFLLQSAHAETARLYKISLLIFKHFPADNNTSARFIQPWSEEDFSGKAIDNFLPTQQSALANAYYTLSRNKNYAVLYHASWIASLQYGERSSFYFNKNFTDNGDRLDGLIDITLKYNLDVHFQTQLLIPVHSILALDEAYQTPSDQLHYIDGPIYSALIMINRYDGN